jgi:Rap1a immunity proteins
MGHSHRLSKKRNRRCKLGGVLVLRTRRQSLGILVMLTFIAVMDARVCVWEETMFLLARYTVAAAVFLSASAASAVEDATLSAYRMLPACTAFIADKAPSEIDAVFHAGRCIGLMQGLGYASRLFGVCPPDEVTLAEKARVAVTYVEARPERMSEDFRVLAVEAMQKAWPCK